ncbi:MAG: glutaredoxin family protein [Planctomycetaceae bacterium]|jgi:glutaredoxin|nr:glutaredoxin family protein [Planctomycetaceae bacterium]
MEKVVVLFSREGCHLCERAEDFVKSYFPECLVLNVDSDEETSRLYGARVPVLVIEGKAVLEGNFVEAELLRLAQATTSQDEYHGHLNHE